MVTSSGDAYETLIRTTSLPLPDSAASGAETEQPRYSTACVSSHRGLLFARSLPHDANMDRQIYRGHVPRNGGDRRPSCLFDNRVYSPGGSSSSRCSDDDDDEDDEEGDEDEILTSHRGQLPVVLRELANEKYVYSRTTCTILCVCNFLFFNTVLLCDCHVIINAYYYYYYYYY